MKLHLKIEKSKEKKQMTQQTLEILRERERERELVFKPQAKENLVLFAMTKLCIKYKKRKDELYLKKYNSS